MNRITKLFLIVAAVLFITAFMPVEYSQAQIFGGSQIKGGGTVGMCIGVDGADEDAPEECKDIDCDSAQDADNLLCQTESAVGTGLAKDSLAGSGITHTDNFGDFVKKMVNFSLPYLALAAFLGYVIAGFMYVTALGNDEQMQKAKKIIVWVSIGLILVILSYAITNLLTGELVESLGKESGGGGSQI